MSMIMTAKRGPELKIICDMFEPSAHTVIHRAPLSHRCRCDVRHLTSICAKGCLAKVALQKTYFDCHWIQEIKLDGWVAVMNHRQQTEDHDVLFFESGSRVSKCLHGASLMHPRGGRSYPV